MEVVSPDGRSWRVVRRWAPRWVGRGPRARLAAARQRRRRRDGDDRVRWYDWFDLPGDFGDSPGAFLAVIVIVILLVVSILWGLPLILGLIDVVLLLLAVLLGAVARVMFRRPWTVEAVASDGERRTRKVVGWFASGRAAEEWAEQLRHGMGQ